MTNNISRRQDEIFKDIPTVGSLCDFNTSCDEGRKRRTEDYINKRERMRETDSELSPDEDCM